MSNNRNPFVDRYQLKKKAFLNNTKDPAGSSGSTGGAAGPGTASAPSPSPNTSPSTNPPSGGAAPDVSNSSVSKSDFFKIPGISDTILGTAWDWFQRAFSSPGMSKLMSRMYPDWGALQFALVGSGVGLLVAWRRNQTDVKSLVKSALLFALAGVSLDYGLRLATFLFKDVWDVNPEDLGKKTQTT
jgi:hypothetical protein